MKYDVHLSIGGAVQVEIEDPKTVVKNDRWLLDDRGAMVRIDAIVAMVPAAGATGSEREARTLIDGDGDVWMETSPGGGMYRQMNPVGIQFPYSEEKIRHLWGVRED